MQDVNELLGKLRTGDAAAMNELVALLYDELHRLASWHLRKERDEHTLRATALVHEVYLKLAGNRPRDYSDRAHFLAVASRVMRQVLVDYARATAAKKRSGDGLGRNQPISLTADLPVPDHEGPNLVDLLALDKALDALSQEDELLAQIVEMRYFGGMTAEETAEVLNRSVHVVRHDLRLAQAWLRRHVNS